MATNRITAPDEASFGAFLRDRRGRIDPAQLGLPRGRRRTPGLRREEVADRAGISATWYSWLEQGRGGAPSAQAVERLAGALMLSEAERDHLFLLGLGHLPEVRYRPSDEVPVQLQRVLDALEGCPAMVRTAGWDIVAWNTAAEAVLTDYGAMAPAERNVLRMLFLRPETRTFNADWEGVARYVVGAFRADATRAGAGGDVAPLVEELSRLSPEFAAMWRDADVIAPGEGEKRITHSVLGPITFDFSSFAVAGRPDLALMVYTPRERADVERIRRLSPRS